MKRRYRRIIWFFAKVILQIGLLDIVLVRIGFKKYVKRTRSNRLRRIAVRFRELAVEMGGVLIKVGQFLSTRVDVLPEVITNELSGLQDEVPAESFSDIRFVAEQDLGVELNQVFSFINPVPMASASLGQVHRARLKDLDTPKTDQQEIASQINSPDETDQVVVKIQRPNIEKIISTDLAAIRTVGSWLRHYPPIRKRADVPALIAEFARVLYEEIDYLAEGRNIEVFAENFKDNERVCVPKVVWTHTTRKVLTMEDVGGIKIDSYGEIDAAGIERHAVAVVILQVYFKQIFEDGFFHADPHPGNLFIKLGWRDSVPPPEWALTFVDFGMVGRISQDEKLGLREALIAFATRDPDRLVRSYQMLNVLLPNADLELIKKADASTFDLVWGKDMSELRKISPEDVRDLMGEFRELVYQMPFQVPHNLIFLARAIGILAGLCTGLDPNINIWEQIVPYARKLLTLERDGTFIDRLPVEIGSLLTEFGVTFQKIIGLPRLTYSILEKIDRGNLVTHDPKVEGLLRELIRSENRLTVGLVSSVFFFASIQLYLGRENGLAIFLGIVALIGYLWMVMQR